MAEFVFKLESNELITFDSWEDIPEDWECPDCGATKDMFDMTEI